MSTPQTHCLVCETPTPKAVCDACYIEAADKRLTALEAENAELKAGLNLSNSDNKKIIRRVTGNFVAYDSYVKELETKLKLAIEALERIAKHLGHEEKKEIRKIVAPAFYYQGVVKLGADIAREVLEKLK